MKTKARLKKIEQQNRHEIEKMKRKARRSLILSRLILETGLGWKVYSLSIVYGAEAAGMDLEDYVENMREWGGGNCREWDFIYYQMTGKNRAISEMQSSGELAKLQALFREFDTHDISDTAEALATQAEFANSAEQRFIGTCLENKNEQK